MARIAWRRWVEPMRDRSRDGELFQRAGEIFDRRVHEITDDAWDAQTPCADWGVRDLVNHLVAEHLWVPRLLDGETMDEIGDEYDGDVVGDSAVTAWEDAWSASSAAWRGVSDDQEVDLSSGPTPASRYREEMILDLVVHAWDLARGAGLDETADPPTTQRALEIAQDYADEWSGSSMFARPIEVASDEPQVRLLALAGRVR